MLNLFAGDGDDQFAGGAVVAELAEVDALPDAEVQWAVGDGDGKGGTNQRGFCNIIFRKGIG